MNDETWPDYFLEMFDEIFGSKTTKRPRILRSSLASLSILAIITFVWLINDFSNIKYSFEGTISSLLWMFAITYAITINIIGDYFSLWETRFIVSRMKKGGHKRRLLLLFSDFVASMIIFFVGLVIGTVIVNSYLPQLGTSDGWYNDTVSTLIEIFVEISEGVIILSHQDEFWNIFGIFLYTTFFTSIWVWAFQIGLTLWPILKWLRKLLDVDEYPVGSAMTIGGAVLGLATFAITLAIAVLVGTEANIGSQ